MAVPSSGQLSLFSIAKEVELNEDNLAEFESLGVQVKPVEKKTKKKPKKEEK